MKLRLLIGSAGSGKTHRCLQEIGDQVRNQPAGPPLTLLVPEQSSFFMERRLASLPGLNGSFRAQACSFRRLAHLLLQETGGALRPFLSETGKQMVLRHVLEENLGLLQVFSRVSRQPGFTRSLAGALSELKRQCLSGRDLQTITCKLPNQPLLQSKVLELGILQGGMNYELTEKFIDPDDVLSLMAEKLTAASPLAGGEVWIDGFRSFTPQEYGVLLQLLRISRQVTVTLCLDPDVSDEYERGGIFASSRRTWQELRDRAGRLAAGDPHQELEIEIIELSGDNKPAGDGRRSRFAADSGLAHLERNLFRWQPAAQYPRAVPEIQLVAAQNRRAEVEGAARKLITLARDRNLRWREMMVLVRDWEPYQDLLEQVLTEYGVPCFLDRKRSVRQHPLLELLRSAVETLAGNWSSRPLFRYLKTDLGPLERDEVDRLENYVLAFGIRGRRWTDDEPWTWRRRYTLGEDKPPSKTTLEELVWVDATRRRAAAELKELTDTIGKMKPIRIWCQALYALLDQIQAAAQTEAWAAAAESKGQLELAGEHRQVYRQTVELLDELVEALGEVELDAESFLPLLETGMEAIQLALVPPALDQVVVGTLDRTRNPEVRACLVLGANEGILPARNPHPGLFNEIERELLHQAGAPLALGGEQRLLDEQHLLYLGISRASDYLWVSYALADQTGNPLAPSLLIGELKRLFPQLEEHRLLLEPAGREADLDYIVQPERSLGLLATQIRQHDDGGRLSSPWPDVYNWLLRNRSELINFVLGGRWRGNREEPLLEDISTMLYGSELRMGVHQLERFTHCPFAHFMEFGLRVRERLTAEIQPTTMGQFFHAALSQFVAEVVAEYPDLASLPETERQERVEAVVGKLAPQLYHEFALSPARQQHLRKKLSAILHQSTQRLVKQADDGFRPVAWEVPFGGGAADSSAGGNQPQLPALTLARKNGCVARLVGRIDRIDRSEQGGKSRLRVIDYKTYTPKLRSTEVFHGLALQLPAYLEVVRKWGQNLNLNGATEPPQPAAALYSPVRQKLVKTSARWDEDKLQDKISRELRPVGIQVDATAVRNSRNTSTLSICSQNELELLLDFVQDLMAQTACAILEGRVEIEPASTRGRDACQYCRYHAVCQFDRLLANACRLLPEVTVEEFWNKLAERKVQP